MLNTVEEVKNKLDIVEIISGYVALTQVGGNFKARCPFHNEKTPSFMVSKEKQIWHCFGCDKGGDLISFVQEYEGISFAEALRMLADKARVPLDTRAYSKKIDYNYLYDINNCAADFYQQQLFAATEAGRKTRDYLAKRGLTIDSIKKWRLGLSGSGWDELLQYLLQRSFSSEQIFQAGLIIQKKSGSGYVDRFRQRLMFPISDPQGRPVAFTSRTLAHIVFSEEDLGGKYINSPQTAIYDKGRLLYGWDQAKEVVRQKKYLIVVEGNLDVIMAQQAGTANTVAVSGTAMTVDHIKLIKRYTNNMILAFDGDAAGSRAAFKSFTLGWQADMNLKILVLSGGQDPADMAQAAPPKWLQAVREAVPVMDYYFRRIVAGVDLTRADHKKIAVAKLLPIIKFLKSKIEQAHYLKLLSDKLQIPLSILEGDLAIAKSFLDKPVMTPAASGQSEREKKESFLILTENLLSLALFSPTYLTKIVSDLEPEKVAEGLHSLYKKIIIYYTKHQNLEGFQDQTDFTPQERQDLIHLVMLGQRDYADFSAKDLAQDFADLVKRLKLRYAATAREKLIAQLRQAELSGNKEEEESLIHKINLLEHS